MDPFNPLDSRRLDRHQSNSAAAAAASRQKSCNACVRGKRRCDKKAPRCTRCASKGLECVYQKMPPGGVGATVKTTHVSSVPTAAAPPSGLDFGHSTSSTASSESASVVDVPDFDMDFGMPSLGSMDTSPESFQTEPCTNLPTTATTCSSDQNHNSIPGLNMDSTGLNFNLADLMAGTGGNTEDVWLTHFNTTNNAFGDGSSKMDIPPLPVPVGPPMPIRDLSLLRDCGDGECSSIDVDQRHDPRSAIGFIVQTMQQLHLGFSQTGALPFLHPRLYAGSLPQTMLRAFCAASAYAGRTPDTHGWVARLLADNAKEIMREGSAASTAREKLARVQAKLIMDAMRVFDGDMALGAAVDKERPVFLEWIKELVHLRDELEEGVSRASLVDRNRPPKSWESWILLESLRRSFLIAQCFTCLVLVLKQEDPNCDIWTPEHHFTASKHLWEAQTSVDFYRAWREKPQFLVNNLKFKDFWMYARPDDLDEFTKILLTTQTGPEAMDHFMQGDIAMPLQ